LSPSFFAGDNMATGTTSSSLKAQLKTKSRARREALGAQQTAMLSTASVRNDLCPDLELVRRPLNSLKAPARRLRKVEKAQVERVKRAIESLGQCVPILITAAGEIIDGETRRQAAQELGLQEVWCVIVDHLTPEQVRLLRLQTNRIQELGSWELDELRLEFSELLTLDLPLEVTGFALAEIDQIVLSGDPEEEGEEEGLKPDEDAPPVCRPGDIWALGDHVVACGDSRDNDLVGCLFEEGLQARLVLTDPPYNVPVAGHVTSGEHREFAMASGEMSREQFASFNRDWMAAALPHLRDGGLLAPFIDWRSVALMIEAGEALGLSLLNVIVWAKTNAGMGSLWRSQHELLPVLKMGKAPHINNVELGRYGRWRSNVWTYPGASSLGSDARDGLKAHPTTKPVAMLVDALLDVTDPGDIVLDPFLGSGSTLIAAERTGRMCRAIEIDPAYVDVAIRRWIKETGQEPNLLNPGRRASDPDLLRAPSEEEIDR